MSDPAMLEVRTFLHPQGCRTHLVFDPVSLEALVLDPHSDTLVDVARALKEHDLRLRWIVDSHTHADHPSGAAPLAAQHAGVVRAAHPRAGHSGITKQVEDGDPLALGDRALVARHTPGHTPDHLVLLGEGCLFSGDSLMIGAVARTDFLHGDAGQLFDSIHETMLALPDTTRLLPGHDYEGRSESTIGQERRTNPWLAIGDRDVFVKKLTANRPPEPANMPALLRFNREGQAIAPSIDAGRVVDIVKNGGAGSVIDVRTEPELRSAHILGSHHILLDTLPARLEEIRRTPAPRLLLCHVGQRAEMARRFLESRGVAACQTIVGGIDAYVQAGGEVVGGAPGTALDAGGACAAGGPDLT